MISVFLAEDTALLKGSDKGPAIVFSTGARDSEGNFTSGSSRVDGAAAGLAFSDKGARRSCGNGKASRADSSTSPWGEDICSFGVGCEMRCQNVGPLSGYLMYLQAASHPQCSQLAS